MRGCWGRRWSCATGCVRDVLLAKLGLASVGSGSETNGGERVGYQRDSVERSH